MHAQNFHRLQFDDDEVVPWMVGASSFSKTWNPIKIVMSANKIAQKIYTNSPP